MQGRCRALLKAGVARERWLALRTAQPLHSSTALPCRPACAKGRKSRLGVRPFLFRSSHRVQDAAEARRQTFPVPGAALVERLRGVSLQLLGAGATSFAALSSVAGRQRSAAERAAAASSAFMREATSSRFFAESPSP